MVGACVGLLDGDALGLEVVGESEGVFVGREVVGKAVGSSVGCLVGANVGWFVGANVGCLVGAKVGKTVGVNVGCLVGAKVGNSVGANVGKTVGANVGCLVGTNVGNTVGANVGNSVGANVGKVVGRGVGSGVAKGVGRKVGKCVGRSVGRAVGKPVLGSELGLIVGNVVGDGVGAFVGKNAGSAVGALVGSPVGIDVGNSVVGGAVGINVGNSVVGGAVGIKVACGVGCLVSSPGPMVTGLDVRGQMGTTPERSNMHSVGLAAQFKFSARHPSTVNRLGCSEAGRVDRSTKSSAVNALIISEVSSPTASLSLRSIEMTLNSGVLPRIAHATLFSTSRQSHGLSRFVLHLNQLGPFSASNSTCHAARSDPYESSGADTLTGMVEGEVVGREKVGERVGNANCNSRRSTHNGQSNWQVLGVHPCACTQVESRGRRKCGFPSIRSSTATEGVTANGPTRGNTMRAGSTPDRFWFDRSILTGNRSRVPSNVAHSTSWGHRQGWSARWHFHSDPRAWRSTVHKAMGSSSWQCAWPPHTPDCESWTWPSWGNARQSTGGAAEAEGWSGWLDRSTSLERYPSGVHETSTSQSTWEEEGAHGSDSKAGGKGWWWWWCRKPASKLCQRASSSGCISAAAATQAASTKKTNIIARCVKTQPNGNYFKTRGLAFSSSCLAAAAAAWRRPWRCA